MDNELTPEEAAEPEPMERARQCQRLFRHMQRDGGYVPAWLRREVTHAL